MDLWKGVSQKTTVDNAVIDTDIEKIIVVYKGIDNLKNLINPILWWIDFTTSRYVKPNNEFRGSVVYFVYVWNTGKQGVVHTRAFSVFAGHQVSHLVNMAKVYRLLFCRYYDVTGLLERIWALTSRV